MSDREVSIRLGKGFWSRGPGPSTILNATDFPTLRTQQAGSGNLALLFQARLELIQLFSNAHDILYSSTSHREQLYTGGEYVRYIVSGNLSSIDTVASVNALRMKLSHSRTTFLPCCGSGSWFGVV